jgi:hypothetical protein
MTAYLLNTTQMGEFLSNGTITGTQLCAGLTIFSVVLNITVLENVYHVPVETDANHNPSVEFYVVVLDTGPGVSTTLIRFNYDPSTPFTQTFAPFFDWCAIFGFAIVGIIFIKRAWTVRREALAEQVPVPTKAQILIGYGFAFLVMFADFMLTQIREMVSIEYGGFIIKIASFPVNNPNFPSNFYDLSIAALFALAGATLMLISYVVETKIRNRKYPIVTIIQVAAIALIMLVLAIPSLLIFAVFFLVASILLAIGQIIVIYFVIIHKNAGQVRRNAIYVLLGILIVVACFVLRVFGQPWGAGNPWYFSEVDWCFLVGLVLFYLGNLRTLNRND